MTSIVTEPAGASASSEADSPVHRGSSSPTLTGRAVVVSWVVSVLIHAMALIGMLLLVFPYGPTDEAADPPEAFAQIVGPIDAPSLTPSSAPDLRERIAVPQSLQDRPVPKDFAEVADTPAMKKPELSIVGIGASGADLESYRLPMDMGGGVEFFGLGRSARGARSVVYVVDRSGSMTGTFQYVQEELRRSIGALRRNQKFHVIFFSGGQPLEPPPGRLVSAIHAHKEQFFDFLRRVVPQGTTRPEWAMRRALSLEPDVVYLLSDGIDFQTDLLARLDGWNPHRRTRIYTIAYLDRTGAELLEQIAREHHGEFRFVTDEDLP